MADDDTFVVGGPLPRIAAVTIQDGLRIVVTWESDGPSTSFQVVDLAPAVFRYKLYAPLRDDPALFSTVRVVDDGFAVAWGDGDDLDMASTTIAELAEQAMTPADFSDFMRRNNYTLDSVAAELGISRRLAAYYTKDRDIPRALALACRYLDRHNVVVTSDGLRYTQGGSPALVAPVEVGRMSIKSGPVVTASGMVAGYAVGSGDRVGSGIGSRLTPFEDVIGARALGIAETTGRRPK